MPQTPNSNPTFNIGITMAGAGSAGCYTGGVMDYLFEILDLWDKAKKKKLLGYEEFYDLIPRHNVLIDVLGGTSAGGITSCMSAIYALSGNINPVKDAKIIEGKRDNIFYDNWVMLDDDDNIKGIKTLAKAFGLEDLEDNKFVSLLNTKIIDDIADNALKVSGEIEKQVSQLPDYISKDLDILQVHTMLRGIPLAINFGSAISDVKGVNEAPSHNSFEHFMVSHYKFNYGKETDRDNFLWFNPYQKEYLDVIALTTKSTGAFPVGLKFREIDDKTFTNNYLKCTTETTIFNRFGQDEDKKHLIDWKNFPTHFNFCTIDGGAINNEPFGEVLGILKSRYGQCIENGYPKYGIIMIDPFPDEVDINETYEMPDDLYGVIPQIINSLHEQSKVKKDDLVEASEHPYFRGEIFPRRWRNFEKDKYPITTGSVSAFGGFLDIKFRHYDFFLARDNARNYFRYYFSFQYYKDEIDPSNSIIHPIHRSWTQEMIEAFKVTGKDKKTYLPIIPDLNILQEKKTGRQRDPFEYTIEEKPKYDPTQLFKMRRQIEDRFEKILDVTKLRLQHKSKEIENTETGKWMDKYYHKKWWDTLKGWIIKKAFNTIFSATKGGLARNITEMAVKWVVSDLDTKQMLKESGSK
jgi:hypothetical protein